MNTNQKGFAKIALVAVIVVLIGVVGYLGVVGYFTFVKKSEPIAQQFNPDTYKYPIFAKIANKLINLLK